MKNSLFQKDEFPSFSSQTERSLRQKVNKELKNWVIKKEKYAPAGYAVIDLQTPEEGLSSTRYLDLLRNIAPDDPRCSNLLR